jgi:hypothetical protein
MGTHQILSGQLQLNSQRFCVALSGGLHRGNTPKATPSPHQAHKACSRSRYAGHFGKTYKTNIRLMIPQQIRLGGPPILPTPLSAAKTNNITRAAAGVVRVMPTDWWESCDTSLRYAGIQHSAPLTASAAVSLRLEACVNAAVCDPQDNTWADTA